MANSQNKVMSPIQRLGRTTLMAAMVICGQAFGLSADQTVNAQTTKPSYTELEVAEKYRVQLPPFDADKEDLAANRKDNRDAERLQREAFN
jgi:hypothetical protein